MAQRTRTKSYELFQTLRADSPGSSNRRSFASFQNLDASAVGDDETNEAVTAEGYGAVNYGPLQQNPDGGSTGDYAQTVSLMALNPSSFRGNLFFAVSNGDGTVGSQSEFVGREGECLLLKQVVWDGPPVPGLKRDLTEQAEPVPPFTPIESSGLLMSYYGDIVDDDTIVPAPTGKIVALVNQDDWTYTTLGPTASAGAGNDKYILGPDATGSVFLLSDSDGRVYRYNEGVYAAVGTSIPISPNFWTDDPYCVIPRPEGGFYLFSTSNIDLSLWLIGDDGCTVLVQDTFDEGFWDGLSNAPVEFGGMFVDPANLDIVVVLSKREVPNPQRPMGFWVIRINPADWSVRWTDDIDLGYFSDDDDQLPMDVQLGPDGRCYFIYQTDAGSGRRIRVGSFAYDLTGASDFQFFELKEEDGTTPINSIPTARFRMLTLANGNVATLWAGVPENETSFIGIYQPNGTVVQIVFGEGGGMSNVLPDGWTLQPIDWMRPWWTDGTFLWSAVDNSGTETFSLVRFRISDLTDVDLLAPITPDSYFEGLQMYKNVGNISNPNRNMAWSYGCASGYYLSQILAPLVNAAGEE